MSELRGVHGVDLSLGRVSLAEEELVSIVFEVRRGTLRVEEELIHTLHVFHCHRRTLTPLRILSKGLVRAMSQGALAWTWSVESECRQ